MHPIPVLALCCRPWVSPRFLELSAPTRHRALPLCLRPSLPHPAPAPSVAPGFDLMAAFGLVQKEYASIRGVAMEPSALGPAMTFTLFKDAQLTRRARWEGRGWAQQGCHTGRDPGCGRVALEPHLPVPNCPRGAQSLMGRRGPGLRLGGGPGPRGPPPSGRAGPACPAATSTWGPSPPSTRWSSSCACSPTRPARPSRCGR